MSKRILIVDDHPLFADAMVQVLARLAPERDVLVVATMAAARESLATEPRPGLVLLDLNLPDSPGSQSLAQLRETFGQVPVAVVSAMDDALRRRQALAAGARAFISKSARPEEMMRDLSGLLGQAPVAPHGPQAATTFESTLPLSTRQLEVLELIGEGKSNKEVARALGVSPGTVKVHLRDIFERLGVHNRTEAAALYAAGQSREPEAYGQGPSATSAELARGLAQVPRVDRALHRERLYDDLDQALARGHVWIHAPPASGKTTLAAGYIRQRRLPVAWVTVREGDHLHGALFHELQAALEAVLGRKVRELPRWQREYEGGDTAFARGYFESLAACAPARLTLVLDNFELALADDGAMARVLAPILVRPRGVRLLLLSRQAPPADAGVHRGCPALIDERALAFTQAETAQLVGEARAAQVLERSRGWAGGIRVLADSAGADRGGVSLFTDTGDDGREALNTLFRNEVFTRLTEAERRRLPDLAWLPWLDEKLAERLQLGDGLGLLQRLHEYNLFVSQSGGREPRYQLHPLFRDLLLEGAPPPTPAAARCAAAALQHAGDLRAAAQVLIQAGAWPALTDLLVEVAETHVDGGQGNIWLDWARRLPTEVAQSVAPLLYWRGQAAMEADPDGAQTDLEAALEAFVAVRNKRDTWLTWCALVQFWVYQFRDYAPLGALLDRYESLKRTLGRPLQPTLRVRVDLMRYVALNFTRPETAALPRLERNLRRLVPLVRNVTARLQIAAMLMRIYSWRGDLPRSGALVEQLGHLQLGSLPPLARLLWRCVRSMHAWYGISPQEGIEQAREGLDEAQRVGIHLLDFTFLIQAIYAAHALGDVDRAREFTRRMRGAVGDTRYLHQCHYMFMVAWLRIVDGRYAEALELSRQSLALGENAGMPYATQQGYYLHAQCLWRNGDRDAALDYGGRGLALAQAHDYGPFIYLHSLNLAQIESHGGDPRRAREHRERARQIREFRGYRHVPFWSHAALAEVFGSAAQSTPGSWHERCTR